MRSVQIEASTHDQLRASAPCLALTGTAGAVSCLSPSIPLPPSCPPSLGTVLLSVLPVAHRHCSTMRALTPAAPRQRDRSLRSICLPSAHPTPNHVVRPNVTYLSPRTFGRSLSGPRLRHLWAGSPQHAAESGSSSCGLSVRLRLLPTPPRGDATIPPLGDAVAFGYICGDFTWHGLSPC